MSAYVLTEFDYDPSGNLLAMKRYLSAGTLIDNLTHLLLGTVGLKANESGTDDCIPNDAQPLDDPANNPNMIPVDVDDDGVIDCYWDATDGDTEDGTPAQEAPIDDADDDDEDV